MGKCSLHYIPQRLHWDEKDIINEFFHGEELYVRHKVGEIPFMTKPLYEISINRQGDAANLISHPSDVLFNIDPSVSNQTYQGMSYDTMNVKRIDQADKTYVFLHDQKDGVEEDNKGMLEMKLIHDPLPCNYSHSLFRLTFNGKLIDRESYKQSIGKKNSVMSKLRDLIRKELDGMIYRNEVPLGKHTV